MQLNDVSYTGPASDDSATLDELPPELSALLQQINGFIQFGGGLHIRGACLNPSWHSLREAMHGDFALHKLYETIGTNDVPFGEDALGDQFVLRDGDVCRLYGETGDLEPLDTDLSGFLSAAQADPVGYLRLEPLIRFQQEGGRLEPGQLLSAYPPFCTEESARGVSLKAVPAEERIRFLAHFASQIQAASDGSKIKIETDH